MATNTIQCPHCHQTISIDEALSHQLAQKLEQEYRSKFTSKFEQEKKQLTDLLKQRLAEEKVKVAEELQKNVGQEVILLKDQLASSQKKLDETRNLELELRKQKVALEDEHKNLALKLQRQLDEERIKIKAEVEKQSAETQDLKIMELQKQLQDAAKANEDLRRKLQQGSQQTQGEVLELELEQLIKTEFPLDEILPVPKGVRGADVIQMVRDSQGRPAGSIIWELKHAQWSDGWLEKLRADQRASKADLAVLVSVNLPKDLLTFGQRQGVWVTNRPTCVALAHVLRQQLIQVAVTKLAAVGKNEKMEVLYSYLSGLEFKQRVEGIVEAFSAMQDDLEKEKRWFNSKWAKQEKNLRRVIDQTIGMHGDLQSIMGASLPEIKQLQLENGEVAESLF
jgi:hypothetical protein